MSETIRKGDIVRTKGMRSPAMLVVKLDFQNDETELAELVWFDAHMNARQMRLDTTLLEHVPPAD